ncbi:MAG: NAD(P)H-hydrate dehydratase [Saprospiraceae bacterium]|nr:NAD(P)H-hydrate dehydratase [Saprospiraceae bacterium]
MKILTSKQIRDIDQKTMEEEAISSSDLMERAGQALTQHFCGLYSTSYDVVIVCGPGNNGGDGLVMARLLREKNYEVTVWVITLGTRSYDNQINLDRLRSLDGITIQEICEKGDLPALQHSSLVLVDAIFGSGISRPVEGRFAEIVTHINVSGRPVVSIDMPSGLTDENPPRGTIIHAKQTLGIEIPRMNYLLASSSDFVGEWELVNIGLSKKAINEASADKFYLDIAELIGFEAGQRNRFSHKGDFGHSLLICGSLGMMGASLLATEACLRSGSGKVTTHVPRCGKDVTYIRCPEALCSVDEHEFHSTRVAKPEQYSCIGIGCGIGQKPGVQDLVEDILQLENPLVIDADALNIIAHKGWLEKVPSRSIITPHPGEFDRLTGHESNDDRQRIELQRRMARHHDIIVLLKGHYSSVALPDGRLFFNSTGNAGMASGGSGDVLTGLITGLMSQTGDPVAAAITGMYVHGLAGDLALDEQSEESLIARDIIKNLGKAFKMIRT